MSSRKHLPQMAKISRPEIDILGLELRSFAAMCCDPPDISAWISNTCHSIAVWPIVWFHKRRAPRPQRLCVGLVGIVDVEMQLGNIGGVSFSAFIQHDDRAANPHSRVLDAIVVVSAFLDHRCIEGAGKKLDQSVRI